MSRIIQRSKPDGPLIQVTPRRPFWTDFRTISNTSATRAVILIPLLGYWIIFNENIAAYTGLVKTLVPGDATTQHHGPPFRLFATYFALCLVAVGSALYQWLCPAEIKQYPGASEYVGGVAPELSSIEYARMRKEVEHGDTVGNAAYQEMRKGAGDGADFKRNILKLYFDYCNRRYQRMRFVVAICYGIGFAILGIMSVEIFLRVIRVLYRSLIAAFLGT